jgi:predicted nucleic acid-binding protein
VPGLRSELEELSIAGGVTTCAPVVMELLYSARTRDEYRAVRAGFGRVLTCAIGPREWDRALGIYDSLAERGPKHQRQVGHADLLIAAAAESAGVPVLHYDADFDLITEVSGIDTRWVRPQGSL